MRQTIKFSPYDSLKFGIYLSNGEEFETVLQDTLSPYPPNPFVQVNALFVLKKI